MIRLHRQCDQCVLECCIGAVICDNNILTQSKDPDPRNPVIFSNDD